MIYVDPNERRADTMSIVAEHCAQRNAVTGEFRLIAKACGYLELVLKNLAGFFKAGVIEAIGTEDTDGWRELRWTKTGHYLWDQWANGPARRVVLVAEDGPEALQRLPRFAAQMLIDAGWTIDAAWSSDPVDYHVVSISRFEDGNIMPTERVLVLTAKGHTVTFEGLPLWCGVGLSVYRVNGQPSTLD